MQLKLKHFTFALAAASSMAVAQPAATPSIPKHIAKIISRADGMTKKTAFKVRSVQEEHQVLAALGLAPGTQSLVITDKPYDQFDATDSRTGATREVWFDISSFYPEF